MQPMFPDGELKETSFSAAAVPAVARPTAARSEAMQAERIALEPPVARPREEQAVTVVAIAAGHAARPTGAREAPDAPGVAVGELRALVEHGVAGAEEVALARGAEGGAAGAIGLPARPVVQPRGAPPGMP